MILGLILVTVGGSQKKEKLNNIYQSRKQFFNKSERVFYTELVRQNNRQYHIFSKVRLEDIVEVKSELEWKERQRYRSSIKSRHVDFVLVNKESGKIELAIELDGGYHNNKKQQDSDRKKNKILNDSGISLVRIKTGSNFDDEINKMFDLLKQDHQDRTT